MQYKPFPRILKSWLVFGIVVLVLISGLLLDGIFWNKQLPRLTDILSHQQQASRPVNAPFIPANGNRLLLLMIDGLAVRPFENTLAAGKLPNIQRLMSSRPTSSMRAISTFPSATSPSVQEFLSGRYAGIDTLPGPGAVHAFDREERRIIRYVTQPDAWQWPLPTLFDATKGRQAITVFEGRWDGPTAVLTQFNLVEQAALELIGAGLLASGDRGPVEVFLKSVRGTKPPSVSLVVLNEFDLAAHFHGPDSPRASAALAATDGLIGEIINTLASITTTDRHTMLDETNIVIFGDHGSITSEHFVDLISFFTDRGLAAVDVSTVPHVLLRERLGTLWTLWPDVIMVSGGSNVTQIYLRRSSGGWSENDNASLAETRRAMARPDVAELAQAISTVEGVDQVLWTDGTDGIQVLDGNGLTARIQERHQGGIQGFAYMIPDPASDDPFGYLTQAKARGLVCREGRLQDNCFHTRTEWFDRTVDSDYPGAPALIPKAFQPERFTGDLMATLKPGYSFIRDQKGDHGNLHRDAVLTPLIFNGPRVQACEESHQPRLVDIYPTATVLLGADPDDPAFIGLDGRVLDCVHKAVESLR